MKMTGAVMVFVACVAMGYGRGREYRRRIGELLMIKKIVLMLRGEVRYAASAFPEAFDRISGKVEHKFGKVMGEIAKELKRQPGKPLAQIWKERLKPGLESCALTKEDKNQLIQLGSDLGYLDRDMQLSTIDFYVEQLEGTIEALEKEKEKRSRVYNCLGVFAGIMINLVLL